MSATRAASLFEPGTFVNFRCAAHACPTRGAAEAPGCSFSHMPLQAQSRRQWQPSKSRSSGLGPRSQWCASQQLQGESGCDRTHSLSAANHFGGHLLRILQTGTGCASSRSERRYRGGVRAAINIDRRRHLEEAFKRQLELEAQAEEDSGTCPVDCVTPVRNLAEFQKVLDEAEASDDLVVVDFYNAACGSCKYILPQFVKMCKSGGQGAGGMGGVVFVKHDVRDEYDELTDLARFYRIRMVPMFAFFQDGSRKEQFATRDKQRVERTIKALLNRRKTFQETYGDRSEHEKTNGDS
ncbi:hypothetical protein KFL_005530060 [Klebsormidium nitens]|uniref:Thioredoxin domain-containing protein n=1 Tax=Klebsormidium nitens TaxID=105231 RepID=A0A1Y1ILR1_KLENI|nr:hypothetical protein KFL_005530060 [Klebsormidium nitens]|eukprot:GAQ89706.1 hypothetical protein KFL_005530060 [Klebsormidium nitens]